MSNQPEPAFMQRVANPQDYPVINNDDGSVSTHRMAAEVDEQGNWYAFPTIVQMPDGSLKQFDDNHEALRYNKRIGNVKPFSGMDEALHFAEGGYKTPEFLESARQRGLGE